MKGTANPQYPIMIVDDEEQILLAIDTTLRMAGMTNTITCQDSTKVMNYFSEHKVEIVLLDLTMPRMDGEELLSIINLQYPEVPVIVVTGAVDIETAVRCMKSGAFDYVVKPIEEDRLLAAVRRGVTFRELERENLALKRRIFSDTLEHPEVFSNIVTNNKVVLSVFKYVESIADSTAPVLITGETGTGKELVARAVHASSRMSGEFVAVNVAGLDDHVFSDTLFGHVKGAFTGADDIRRGLVEQAAGGTLMLDEIGDLSQASQLKLLRFLQEGEYFPLGRDEPKRSNVRIVAVTNENPQLLKKTGRFREDLFYRLHTHHIEIPPLRERMQDIPLLADYFLEEAARALNKKKPSLPAELWPLLGTYSFPGNVRELRSMVVDAVSTHKSGTLSLSIFRSHIAREQRGQIESAQEPQRQTDCIIWPLNLPTKEDTIKMLEAEALKRAKGNQSIAASMLGISQQALSKRLKQNKQDS
ncbi:MAG: sigma-54-dependent Fis family transcriptional regulator [Deltaproteobacteria bacterium]|nr:sigma-54-dependent Fis family transcriptional regulator [Deltaproteobacteria bacterium]